MKKGKMNILKLAVLIIFIIPMNIIYSQELKVVTADTIISGSINSELISNIHLVNNSNDNQIVFIIRTINNLPLGWSSSLCFGGNCFSPKIDSIFSSKPLYPGDTAEASIHFSTDKITPGTAYVQVEIGIIQNSDIRSIINIKASTIPAIVNVLTAEPDEITLMQNYPNPFNPKTNFEFRISNFGFVSLKVYNLLGKEVATIVNEELTSGKYHFPFSILHFPLTSGIYFYQLKANGKVLTKKMVLAK